MFDKAKMLAQAYKLKMAVEAEVVEVEENGMKIQVGGDQKVKYLSINGVENKALMEIINKGIRKAQEVAAIKMKEIGGLEGLT